MVLVSVYSISVHEGAPVITLQSEEQEEEFLPIWLSPTAVESIMSELGGERPMRPLTPDLLCATIEALGASVVSGQINDLVETTYVARLLLEQDEEQIMLDARPSDVIAVALRAGVPIEVDDKVFSENKTVFRHKRGDEEDVDVEGEVERFKEFLEQARPEDFLRD